MNIDNILLDLEVIKQVKENDKLSVLVLPGNKRLIVDSYSYFSSITRKYNGYNRDDTIKYLEELVDIINKSCATINNGNHSDLAETLNNSIKNSIIGLENLKKTYKNDSIIIAKLVLIINKLNNSSSLLSFSDVSLSEITDIENNTINTNTNINNINNTNTNINNINNTNNTNNTNNNDDDN